jgi:predicted metal-dependent HD superfamily phosphohydrolase
VELALWFHDAIYDTHRSDNEERSADWAKSSVRNVRVHALVMATRHEAVPHDIDAQVLVDVDLWILSAPEERFDEYEAQIRQEYGWVPGPIYRHKRKAILESFVARAAIYNTSRFIERYEAQARANLARSLARL